MIPPFDQMTKEETRKLGVYINKSLSKMLKGQEKTKIELGVENECERIR